MKRLILGLLLISSTVMGQIGQRFPIRIYREGDNMVTTDSSGRGKTSISARNIDLYAGVNQLRITINGVSKYYAPKQVLSKTGVPYSTVSPDLALAGINSTIPPASVGPRGPQGEAGPQGPTGATGGLGPVGQRGSWWTVSGVDPVQSFGNGLPYDIHLNYASGTIFQQLGSGRWLDKGNIKGPKGDTGPKGQPGDTGPAGAKGDTGPAGIQGSMGSQGPQGSTGATGATGPQGATGATGAKGDKGDTGSQGVAGATGATGTNGTNGRDAFAQTLTITTAPAVGTTVSVNLDNNAWLTTNQVVFFQDLGYYQVAGLGGQFTTLVNLGYSGNAAPGQTAGIGARVRPAGIQGPAGKDAFGNLLTSVTAPAAGSTVAVNLDNTTWLTTNQVVFFQDLGYYQVAFANQTGAATLINLGYSTNAPQGTTAGATARIRPAGIQGPKGDTGAAGATGATGATGAQGPKGDTGAAGSQGVAGATGATGATGAQGPKGDTGATGPQGATGPAGTGGAGLPVYTSLSGLATATADLVWYDNSTWAKVSGNVDTNPENNGRYTALQYNAGSNRYERIYMGYPMFSWWRNANANTFNQMRYAISIAGIQLKVEDGTYNFTDNVWTPGNFTIIGNLTDPSKVVFNATGTETRIFRGWFWYDGTTAGQIFENIKIEGITFDEKSTASTLTSYGPIAFEGASSRNITVRRCIFKNTSTTAICNGVFIKAGANKLIVDITIEDNVGLGGRMLFECINQDNHPNNDQVQGYNVIVRRNDASGYKYCISVAGNFRGTQIVFNRIGSNTDYGIEVAGSNLNADVSYNQFYGTQNVLIASNYLGENGTAQGDYAITGGQKFVGNKTLGYVPGYIEIRGGGKMQFNDNYFDISGGIRFTKTQYGGVVSGDFKNNYVAGTGTSNTPGNALIYMEGASNIIGSNNTLIRTGSATTAMIQAVGTTATGHFFYNNTVSTAAGTVWGTSSGGAIVRATNYTPAGVASN